LQNSRVANAIQDFSASRTLIFGWWIWIGRDICVQYRNLTSKKTTFKNNLGQAFRIRINTATYNTKLACFVGPY
jgi:hypothetical protein